MSRPPLWVHVSARVQEWRMRYAWWPRWLSLLVLATLLPAAVRAEEWHCPPEGRLDVPRAPTDFHDSPDARCTEGGLLYLVGPEGQPYPQMTRVGPGWYLTRQGYELLDRAFRRRGEERDAATARAQAAAAVCGRGVESCGTATTRGEVQAPPSSGWGAGAVLVVAGLALAGGVALGYSLARR